MEQWADPNRPFKNTVKDSPYVWKLDLKTKQIKNKDPKNIANKPANYYLLEDDNGKSVYPDLEQKLGEVEADFLKIIREKVENNIDLKVDDREIIALFMSLAIFRKPSHIDKFSNFVDKILNDSVLPHIKNKIKSKKYSEEELQKIQKEYLADTGNLVSIEQLQDGMNNIDSVNFEASLTKNKKLTVAFGENIHEWKRFIKNYNWLFLEGKSFVTGDLNYFSMFPLTPKICIVLTSDELKEKRFKITEEKEREINERISKNCESFVVAQDKTILEILQKS